MKKYFFLIFLSFVLGGGISFLRLWVESPESVRLLLGKGTELSLRDNSVLISKKPATTLPKVKVMTQNRNELMMNALEERSRIEMLECEKESEIYSDYLLRPRQITANITKFGGSWDRVVTRWETGSVGGNRLRSLNDSKDFYVAWPMPDVTDKNPKSPMALPSVEEYFGSRLKSRSQKIAAANKALRDYMVEISYTCKEGHTKTVLARVEDRGPRNPNRFDASRAVWEKLGLASTLKGSPNSSANAVTLTLRLVKKDEVESKETETDVKTQFSKIGNTKFQLPIWDREEEENMFASK